MITINANLREPIFLRHAGEENALRVAFDLQEFEAHWPGGVPALLVRRPISSMDAAAYPVPLSVDGRTAFWTVSASDTECSGYGKAQLQWRVGGTLAKSCVYDTVCAPSLIAGDAPPDAPSKAWFEAIQTQIGDLSKLTTKAKENLVAAINEAARTGGGSGGGTIDMRVSGGYIQYSSDGATWENLIAVEDLKGEAGPQGEQGIQGLKGDPGKDGATGPAGKDGITPTIGANGNWYLGDTDTQKPSRGEKGADGAAGKDGSDGYSPEATVTPINGGAKIIIKDKNGTTSANVMNGAQGPRGIPGPKGDSYTLTPADKIEIAGDVVANGVQAELGDEPVSLGVSGAAIGQIAKITAVDAQGVPTKWEAVDLPCKEWRKIIDADSISEPVTSFSSGNVDAFSEFYVLAHFPSQTLYPVAITVDSTRVVQCNDAINSSREVYTIFHGVLCSDTMFVEYTPQIYSTYVTAFGMKRDAYPVSLQSNPTSLIVSTNSASQQFEAGAWVRAWVR